MRIDFFAQLELFASILEVLPLSEVADHGSLFPSRETVIFLRPRFLDGFLLPSDMLILSCPLKIDKSSQSELMKFVLFPLPGHFSTMPLSLTFSKPPVGVLRLPSLLSTYASWRHKRKTCSPWGRLWLPNQLWPPHRSSPGGV